MNEEEVSNQLSLLRQGCEGQAVNSDQLKTNSEEQTGALQGESLNPKLEASATLKTQGLRSNRADAGRRTLERAAKAAARTGNRGDVHAYMRIRRSLIRM